MKKFLLIPIFCIIYLHSFAQSSFKELFLFETFLPGKVVYKTEATKEALLNYNKVDECMYFVLQNADSTILELTMTSFISEVWVVDRVFEHIKEGQFYERVDVDGGSFYIRWRSTFVSEGRETGYGMRSATGATENVVKAYGIGTTSNDLKLTETFKTNSHDTYYLKIKDKFKIFNSFKSLAKLLKVKDKNFENYVKSENLNFKELEDVKKAIAYCFQ